MSEDNGGGGYSIESLASFFNNHHDKLLCTVNGHGEPDIALMGTPRLTESGNIDFEISDEISMTFQNIKENRAVVFMAYAPGKRARDYQGARIYAEVTDILTSGEKFENIRNRIKERFGEQKASELRATVTCSIKKVRAIVDRGQRWDEPAFGIDSK